MTLFKSSGCTYKTANEIFSINLYLLISLLFPSVPLSARTTFTNNLFPSVTFRSNTTIHEPPVMFCPLFTIFMQLAGLASWAISLD